MTCEMLWRIEFKYVTTDYKEENIHWTRVAKNRRQALLNTAMNFALS